MKAVDRLMDLSEQYRPAFLARTRREKALGAAFLVVIAIVWFGSFSGRVGATLQDNSKARLDMSDQQRWFDGREQIEAEYQQALATLDPASMPPRAEVLARLQALATQYGLSPRIDPPSSRKSDRLTFHTVNVSFDRVGFSKVAEFQRATAAALPSVNLKTIRITSPSRAPGASEINARLTYEVIENTQ
jgi:hypothetical protein